MRTIPPCTCSINDRVLVEIDGLACLDSSPVGGFCLAGTGEGRLARGGGVDE